MIIDLSSLGVHRPRQPRGILYEQQLGQVVYFTAAAQNFPMKASKSSC
jgi:hypothetical protein